MCGRVWSSGLSPLAHDGKVASLNPIVRRVMSQLGLWTRPLSPSCSRDAGWPCSVILACTSIWQKCRLSKCSGPRREFAAGFDRKQVSLHIWYSGAERRWRVISLTFSEHQLCIIRHSAGVAKWLNDSKPLCWGQYVKCFWQNNPLSHGFRLKQRPAFQVGMSLIATSSRNIVESLHKRTVFFACLERKMFY